MAIGRVKKVELNQFLTKNLWRGLFEANDVNRKLSP